MKNIKNYLVGIVCDEFLAIAGIAFIVLEWCGLIGSTGVAGKIILTVLIVAAIVAISIVNVKFFKKIFVEKKTTTTTVNTIKR